MEHSSELTVDSPTYYRDFQVPKCYYETFEIRVKRNGLYVLWSENNKIRPYGYIYKNDFDPLKPFVNLLLKHDGSCNDEQFKLIINLEVNIRYVLVVTTYFPNTIGNFSFSISGQENISFTPIDGCYVTAIGLTLNDILRDELRLNTPLTNQPISIKISSVVTIIIFVIGLVNSIFSLITFRNTDCQQVGCGMYLLASSITSFVTISMSTIQFWFVVLSQIDVSISLSILRGGCVSIEVILKVFLYLDGWLNACVAIERAVNVFKGVNFDKKKSKDIAKLIILILPFCIIVTLSQELIYRRLSVYPPESEKTTNEDTTATSRYVSCVALYPAAVQDYNTAILFFHLVAPFIANLISALFIIFRGARQRSVTRTDQSFTTHVRKQLSEHKQLIISPIILLLLSLPRLIILLLPGCTKVKTSEYFSLYLGAYFISIIPSTLIFLIFVVPSELYMKTFKHSLKTVRQRIRQ